MPAFSESEIMTLLRIQNPWWMTGKIDERREFSFHRGEYYLCSQTFYHQIRRFPVLSGPRRVGKSTIVYQTIGDLLRAGVNSRKIFYMSLDSAALEEMGILKLLLLYQNQINSDPDFYLFVDEVQKDEDWTSALKFIYDSFPGVHAMATGSASWKIEGKYRETGEGRLRLIRIPTMSFYEYCQLKMSNLKKSVIDNVFNMHELSVLDQSTIIGDLSSLELNMNTYLRIGGFPEYVQTSAMDESYVLSLIEENVINKVIFNDLSASEKVNPIQLRRVFSYLCNITSNIVNVEEISREMSGLTNATVVKYIDILEKAGLIYCAPQVNVSGKKILKARDKIYISDSGIREAVVSNLHSLDDPVQNGYMIESVAYKHTIDYCRCIDPLWQVGYMIQSGTEKEIDIVICSKTGIEQLVESKVRKHSTIKDSDLILTRSIAGRPGYVITKSTADYGLTHREKGDLYRIPAVAYLYLVGFMKYKMNRGTFQEEIPIKL